MEFKSLNRRGFVKTACYATALSAIPGHHAFGQTLGQRLDWDTFKTTSQYPSFVSAIGSMRDNSDANDRRSWTYWINSHLNYCPHGIAYFLAWHRGCLYYFEQYLRMVSGNSALMVPYWDYYKNPNIPAEFTNPAPSNPLYVSRVNTNVSQALSMAPFSNTLTNFPRGTINSFEPSIERKPHDPVHDIIGAVMTTMKSPEDPIFWLHHANIDRLWCAWILAGNGRQMPASSSPYWTGAFTYGPGLTMNRNLTINNRAQMAYFYQNERFPAAALASAQVRQAVKTSDAVQVAPQPLQARAGISRPEIVDFPVSAPRPIDSTRRSVGGARNIPLSEKSVSARIPIDDQSKQLISEILKSLHSRSLVASPAPSIQVVLDDLHLTAVGEKGGYFYNVYVNLPATIETSVAEEKYLLGGVGPFAIAAALHHIKQHDDHARGSLGAQPGAALLRFPATRILAGLPAEELSALTVSFVRVSGDNSPKGVTINVGELRIEISTDDLE